MSPAFSIFALFIFATTGSVFGQRRITTSVQTGVDFDCPDEFGYYPHPADCTQYYVCVFGGALLESCTGGLMYSHELQTCDWPRNVGCTEAGAEPIESATASSVTRAEPISRGRTTSGAAQAPSRSSSSRGLSQQQHRQQQQQRQDELVKQQLYADELGPAEEIESDRQQRVYRGQPSNIGQVARDRDGLGQTRHQVTNAIPASRDKLQYQTQQQPQQQAQQQQTQYHRVEVTREPPPPQPQQQQVYIVQQTSPRAPLYNTSRHQAANTYDGQQYDLYNLYDEDVELYRDTDYGQYAPNPQSVPSRGRQPIVDVYQQQQPATHPPAPIQQDYQNTYQLDPEVLEYETVSVRPQIKTPSRQQITNTRNRGSSAYTTGGLEAPLPSQQTVNRGTPASVRSRPTLKPSTAIVSKAQEFIDIYRFPPSRPEPVYPTPTPDKTAAKCRKDVCLLPDCNCGGKDIPGDLDVEQTPQLVLLTFDDAINDLNKELYSDLFERGRRNPNGCPISATYYVSHEWTDYSQVQNLYADGHEMASHSVSHSFGEQFSQKKWNREIGGQREILSAYGGVKLEDVRGMRAPFLAVGGNKMFKMLYDSNFTYDSSMPVYENRPPSWPYTLDYKLFHDCMIPPCPTRSYPGVWEVPMVMWQDLNGGRCSMGDACSNPPTADGVYKMLVKNFERHYTTNRAPFGLFYHAAWFTQPHHKEAFISFIDTINAMKDVWLVTNWQALQWIRDPTPNDRLANFQPFQCNYPDRPKRCNNPKVCNLWHKSGVRYMRTCQPCPDIYPWTGKTGVRNSRVDNEIEE